MPIPVIVLVIIAFVAFFSGYRFGSGGFYSVAIGVALGAVSVLLLKNIMSKLIRIIKK